jgi:hypothetical protein
VNSDMDIHSEQSGDQMSTMAADHVALEIYRHIDQAIAK